MWGHAPREPAPSGVEGFRPSEARPLHISRYVDDKLTVVVLTNLADAEPGKIAGHVAELYLNPR
ncbi:MAG: hypothetical protein ACLP6G_01280 [Terriglobales bacterium]